MKTAQEIKSIVKEKYGEMAKKAEQSDDSSCCGCGCGSDEHSFVGESYDQLQGYEKDADLGLGCGIPTEFAKIKEGDTVVDLGSGAGNDAFVARALTGPDGKVIGVDMTEDMIQKANRNRDKLDYQNVEFRLGEIENMPIKDNTADVVLSNCVLNLVPDKENAFSETYRILKPGGHFSISDIVLEGELPEPLKEASELYVGCVSGANQKQEYLNIIEKAGFKNVQIQKQRKIDIPDEVLTKYLNDDLMQEYRKSNIGIFSITVYGEKPDNLN